MSVSASEINNGKGYCFYDIHEDGDDNKRSVALPCQRATTEAELLNEINNS